MGQTLEDSATYPRCHEEGSECQDQSRDLIES
jgi:hypothetical protein